MRNNIITIHYGEIALKGKQRGRFESMLIRNVQEITGFRPMRMSSRLFLKEWNDDTRYLLSIISNGTTAESMPPENRASTLPALPIGTPPTPLFISEFIMNESFMISTTTFFAEASYLKPMFFCRSSLSCSDVRNDEAWLQRGPAARICSAK